MLEKLITRNLSLAVSRGELRGELRGKDNSKDNVVGLSRELWIYSSAHPDEVVEVSHRYLSNLAGIERKRGVFDGAGAAKYEVAIRKPEDQIIKALDDYLRDSKKVKVSEEYVGKIENVIRLKEESRKKLESTEDRLKFLRERKEALIVEVSPDNEERGFLYGLIGIKAKRRELAEVSAEFADYNNALHKDFLAYSNHSSLFRDISDGLAVKEKRNKRMEELESVDFGRAYDSMLERMRPAPKEDSDNVKMARIIGENVVEFAKALAGRIGGGTVINLEGGSLMDNIPRFSLGRELQLIKADMEEHGSDDDIYNLLPKLARDEDMRAEHIRMLHQNERWVGGGQANIKLLPGKAV